MRSKELSEKLKNLEGKKYKNSRLTILEFFFKKGKGKYQRNATWCLCQCDCGNLKEIRWPAIRAGNTNSCGCIFKETIKKPRRKIRGKNHPRYIGYEDVPSKIISQFKTNAKTRNIGWHLDAKQIWEKYLEQDKKCIFTGLELKFNSTCSIMDGNVSIDRINSDDEYYYENIQLIHKYLNLLKLTLNNNEFIEYCKILTKNPWLYKISKPRFKNLISKKELLSLCLLVVNYNICQ